MLLVIFASFNAKVCAEDTCKDSLICGDRIIEILFITALLAVCVMFLIQSIIIACLSYKLKKFQERVESMNSSIGSYKNHAFNPYFSTNESGISEIEDITYMPLTRTRRFTASFPTDNNNANQVPKESTDRTEFTIVDANDRQKQIWGLYWSQRTDVQDVQGNTLICYSFVWKNYSWKLYNVPSKVLFVVVA